MMTVALTVSRDSVAEHTSVLPLVYLGFAAVMMTQEYMGVYFPRFGVLSCLVRHYGLFGRQDYTSATLVLGRVWEGEGFRSRGVSG